MSALGRDLLKTVAILAVFSFAAPVVAGNPSPKSVDGAKTIGAKETRALWLKGVAFIDPRSSADWDAGRIPGSLHMERGKPVYSEQTVLDFVKYKTAPIVSYCNAESCHRSAKLAQDLVKWGFSEVYYFRDGYPAWLETGSPFE
ncbi:MAG: rhodanese-like domain-containing protein [Methyloprofundus sp.]|nr:rhodanese-like domain-containing protein [Methyloprofundus sp.]